MIIKQKDTVASNLNQKLTKLGHRRLDIKLEELESLENTIQSMMKRAQKRRKESLKKILSSIRSITTNCRNGTIPILWYCNDGLVWQYPVDLANYPEDGIDCMDYIIRPNNSMAIRVHYSQLVNTIAFEMMYKDLGYTHKQIEEKLYDVSIINQNPVKILMDIIGDEEPYKLSKMYKIQKSSYRSEDDNVIFDYFQNTAFYTDYYSKPVEYSCRQAIAFILDSMLDSLKEYNVPFTLCAMDDNSMTFIIDKGKQNEFVKIATEPVAIRAFGRSFNTTATVEDLEGAEDLK